MANEYVLSLNKFGTPKVLKDTNSDEATQTLITRLILMDPGTIQSHPEMGVGLISKYRFMYVDEIDELRNNIKLQMNKYLPFLQNVTVEVDTVDNVIRITLFTDSGAYEISVDKNTGKIVK